MNNYLKFIFFAEENCKYQNNVRTIISKLDLPFCEIYKQDVLFNQLQQENNLCYFIICIDSEQMYNYFNKLSQSLIYKNYNFFVIYGQNFTNELSCPLNNFCLYNNLNQLEQFLIKSLLENKEQIIPSPQPFLKRIIDTELTKLDISKKYVGFRYLVDFIAMSLSHRCYNLDTYQIIDLVASMNNTNTDTIDHDIRHMLLASWKSSIKLKNSLLSLNKTTFQPSGKNILKNLVSYIKQAI